MRSGNWSRTWRPVIGVLAVGALAFGLKLEGAPVASDAKNAAVVADPTVEISQETIRSEVTRIKLGKIPSSLPIMPVVTANPFDDVPSQLRAAGLLKGPMPLRDFAAGIAAGACTFDIDCEDGDPCTDDFCDIGPGQAPNAGVCNNEAVANNDQGDINGDDCSDGLACNGIETCQGATVNACQGLCVGGDNDGTCVAGFCVGGKQDLQACPNGNIDCKTVCVRETDCGGGGTCGGQVCVGGPSNGLACIDNIACGSSPGICQAPGAGNNPIVCGGGQVCDENKDPNAGCVDPCPGNPCDDGLTCNGVEVCDVGTGLCSSPGNPCGAAAANCLEQACLKGGTGITGTFCETFNDCDPSDLTSCGANGPFCFPGRCCVGLVRQSPNRTFDKRCTGSLGGNNFAPCNVNGDCTRVCDGGANNGLACTTNGNCPGGACPPPPQCRGCDAVGATWYPGDTGQVSSSAAPACPVYSSGIATEGEYLVTAGPASLSPFAYDLTDLPLRKLGDDYDTGDNPVKYIQLRMLRFAGGVTNASNGRIAFEFYDENGNFVEDVFFISAAGANQIQVVQVFALAPTLVIPSRGFIVGHVLQAFGSLTAPGQFLWLSTTAPPDQGVNDPNFLYTDTDLAGTPSKVANFLGMCNGGTRDGLECDPDGDNIPGCPGGTCASVPGVLAFELEGDVTTNAPRGGCCNPATLDCNEVLKWVCTGSGGSYLGDNIACATCNNDSANTGAACRKCSGGANNGLACTGVAGCPGGACVLNNTACAFCSDLTTACTGNGNCTGIGDGICHGACEYNSQCETGACCVPSTGECLEGHSLASCNALPGTFLGLGSDCDPDCCVQPDYSGADHCEDVTISLMEVPGGSVCLQGANKGNPCDTPDDCGGSACERTVVKTVTGNNATASSTIPDPDSCYQPQDAPGAELGWFEGIQIYDPAIRLDDTIACGYLLVDHCCTNPVKIPAYRILYNACPCADTEFTKPNPNHPERKADARGAPFCPRDNAWQQFGPLTGAKTLAEVAAGVGTYYYPILSFLGGNFEQYQFHIRVEACPDAVCCVAADCRVMNILECAAAGGGFLAPPNLAEAVTVCATQCATGSCCTGPGECFDNKVPGNPPASFDPMDPTYCVNTLQGKYVGGFRCFGGVCAGGAQAGQSCQLDGQCPGGGCLGDTLQLSQPNPCPICEIQGPGNCQLFDDSLTQRGSDIALPGGGIHVADDFIALGSTINKVCVWGTYTKPDNTVVPPPTVDCGDTAQDNFRIRVYGSDVYGLPDTSNIIGEANPTPASITRVHVPNSANELTTSQHIRIFGYQIDISAESIGPLQPETCYWLEVVNELDGVCGWAWQTVDTQNNDFSAGGGAGSYGLSSPRNRDMAFCLNTNFEPGACGNPLGYCCNCDGECATQNRRDCLSGRGRWRIEDTCETPLSACEAGASDNDKCLQVVLPGFPDTPDGTARFDNTCANADGINPIDSDFGPGNNIAADVWYKYYATCDGTVTFSTCANGPAAGGGIDTILAAYKDPNNPTQCICPSNSDEQRDATLWYTEPNLANTIGMSGDENCDGLQNGAGGYVEGPATTGDCFMIRVGGFGGQGSEEGAGTVTITCNAGGGAAPGPMVAGGGDLGNRYLRVVAPAPAAAAAGDQVIRVKFTNLDGYAEPAPLYVGAPVAAPEEDGADLGKTFTAAPLSCTPYFTDWTVYSTISIYGAEIMPGSTYAVQRADISCGDLGNEACWSDPLVMTTQKYGDVWPNFYQPPPAPAQPDFGDISALVRKFTATASTCTGGANNGLQCAGPGNCPGGTCDIRAPLKSTCQLQPNRVFPTRSIDFKDIAADVGSFTGAIYSAINFGPCTCPSSAVCGAHACATDLNCAGFGAGLCVNGFCADKCGRCTPP